MQIPTQKDDVVSGERGNAGPRPFASVKVAIGVTRRRSRRAYSISFALRQSVRWRLTQLALSPKLYGCFAGFESGNALASVPLGLA
jgi:hypothetical protein